jgi:hypothetical protein
VIGILAALHSKQWNRRSQFSKPRMRLRTSLPPGRRHPESESLRKRSTLAVPVTYAEGP